MDASLLFGIVVVLAVVWLVDRSKTQARLDDLESALERLAERERAPAPPPRPTAAPASPVFDPAPAPAAAAADVDSDAEYEGEAPAAGPAPVAETPAPISSPATSLRELYGNTPHPEAPPPSELAPVRWLREYFTGGNLIVRVGLVVLLFGVAFLLKYAAEHSHVPIEWRFGGVAAGACVLLALGWRWRTSRPAYALALQGGGVAVLYLVVFAALRLFHLLDPGVAFVLLALIGVFTAVLAVMQDSLALAFFGAGGGFLAPLLAASEHGNHVVLFSYYLLIDLGIVLIAWRKSWRPLNLLAFVGTFGVGAAWGNLSYRPELLASTEPFLLAYFLVFVLIAVLFAHNRAPRFTHYVDGTIVFGTPVVVMGLEAALLHGIPFALAWCAVGFGAFYLVLAAALRRPGREALGLLAEAFIALGVAFATLAIPLALEARWTGASWALEGTAILWVGLRQERRLAVAAGLLLEIAAGCSVGLGDGGWLDAVPLGNSHFVSAALVAFGGFTASLLMARAPEWLERYRAPLSALMLAWGVLWWLYAGITELDHFVPAAFVAHAVVAFLAATALALGLAAEAFGWPAARVPPLALIPVLPLLAIYAAGDGHPSAYGGWWAWPVGLAIAYVTLQRAERTADARIVSAWHCLALWLVVALVSAELAWQVRQLTPHGPAWGEAVWGLFAALALLGLPSAVGRIGWPFATHRATYLGPAANGLAAYLACFVVLGGLGADGNAAPLPYLPVLNPLDLAEGFAVLALVDWWRRVRGSGFGPEARRAVVSAIVAVAFVWINLVLLRAMHHLGGVPYSLAAFGASTTTQAALSIAWTVLALATMLWSARHGARLAWLAGATLMGVVVVKLFLVDFSQLGSITRIVSFLGVGVLMLVVGYFSPVPPAKPEGEA